MICTICKDPILLSQPGKPATVEDLPLTKDLVDTLQAHQDSCVGMAANMIGVPKCIIAFYDGDHIVVMLNPRIAEKSGMYLAQESCLSLSGVREAKRWKTIQVVYENEKLEPCQETFSGWPAQIIQHEVDHCNGILI